MTSCSREKDGLRLGLYRCPACGTQLQIFSDEPRVTCHNCGTNVIREQARCCREWCASVRNCLDKRQPTAARKSKR